MRTIKCPCGSTIEVTDMAVQNPHRVEEESGYHGVMNQRDGLEFTYLCPACWNAAEMAMRMLTSVFKKDAPYISYGPAIRRMMKAEAGQPCRECGGCGTLHTEVAYAKIDLGTCRYCNGTGKNPEIG